MRFPRLYNLYFVFRRSCLDRTRPDQTGPMKRLAGIVGCRFLLFIRGEKGCVSRVHSSTNGGNTTRLPKL